DVLRLGPREGLLADPDITEVRVHPPKHIFVEQRGKITRSPVTLASNEQLMQVIDRSVSSTGRRADEAPPPVDARLHDGSLRHARGTWSPSRPGLPMTRAAAGCTSASWSSTACDCGPIASSSASVAVARRWTCSRR